MTTPEEFVTRCETTIDQMALLYAHSPARAMEPHLAQFEKNVTAGWIETFGPYLPHDDIKEVVAYICLLYTSPSPRD